MIFSFADQETEDIFNGIKSPKARKRLPGELFEIAARKLDMIDAAINLNDLKVPPSNHLEALKGKLEGKYSIRINIQYRVLFSWTEYGADHVKIIDYH